MHTMAKRGDTNRRVLYFTFAGVERQLDTSRIATTMQIPYESPLGHRFRE